MRQRRYKTTIAALAIAVNMIGTISTTASYALSTPSHLGIHKRNPKDGADMVYVPSGKFIMGTDDFTDATPHAVILDSYWIYTTPVTVAQYRKFCKTTGHQFPPAPSFGWSDNNPIVNVNWDDAQAYAKWASASLPTEAQWEKAAKGTDGRQYPWGNTWDAQLCANSVLHSLHSTKPVGSYPRGASPYGALDMAGNVWQWCSDYYRADYYSSSPSNNPPGPNTPTIGDSGTDPDPNAGTPSPHVLRGCAWNYNDPDLFGSSVRSSGYGYQGHNGNIGFRCAVSAR